ncbi:MAG: DUF4097 domain-containing protein [Acidobacteriota bacterium]|nr:DUF4097 domain-containing protein [Acidobacteriota bacterium]
MKALSNAVAGVPVRNFGQEKVRLFAGPSLLLLALICLQHPLAMAYAEGSFQRSLQVNGPINLDVATGSGNIQVRTGASSHVEIAGRIKAHEWFGGNTEEKIKRLEANPPIQQSGNDIHIGHVDDPELMRNISISYELIVPAETRLHSHSGSGNLTIEGIQGPVDADSGSGNVEIKNVAETVRADTGSGNVEIDHVKGNVHSKTGSGWIHATDVAGGFEGSTGSGDVTLQQTAPGTVRVSTGSGGMDLRGVRGSLEARAGSGTIHADGEPTGGWLVNTGSGTVKLRLAFSSAFDLDAHTNSGSITVSQPISSEGTMGRKEVRGKVGGGGVPVNVRTGSGDILIQ